MIRTILPAASVVALLALSGCSAPAEVAAPRSTPGLPAACTPDPRTRAAPATTLSASAARFDATLRRIAQDEDLEAFLALLDPDVTASFGGHSGPQGFREAWIDPPAGSASAFWADLRRMLGFGGTMAAGPGENLVYPYYFDTWDGATDPFETWVDVQGTLYTTGPACPEPALRRALTPLIGPRLYADRTGGRWRVMGFLQGD